MVDKSFRTTVLETKRNLQEFMNIEIIKTYSWVYIEE